MRSITRSGHLYDQAYEILWEKILGGEITPGQRLRDVELADQLKISRTPAREAMRKLEQDGILTALERGGYQVSEVHPADLKGLYRCRASLEGLAARDAAANITPRDATRLEKLIAQTDEHLAKGAFDQALRCNTEFHAQIVELSRNRYLIRLIDSLRRLILFHRSALMNAARAGTGERYAEHLAETQNQHRAVLDALVMKDAERAGSLMERHLLETAADMDELFREMEIA